MIFSAATTRALRDSPRSIARAVHESTPRQAAVAVAVALVVGVAIGWVTVLIPNDDFTREIPPTMWSYPVLVITAVLSGMLAATYVRSNREPSGTPSDTARPGRFGGLGTIASWFAVGCPVCNKFALLALGYSGAQAWFAPVQPALAAIGIGLLWAGLAIRLDGQERCPVVATTVGASNE